jgi:hypothetical protein
MTLRIKVTIDLYILLLQQTASIDPLLLLEKKNSIMHINKGMIATSNVCMSTESIIKKVYEFIYYFENGFVTIYSY